MAFLIACSKPVWVLERVELDIPHPQIVFSTEVSVDGMLEQRYVVKAKDGLYFCDRNFNVLSIRPTVGRVIPSRQHKYFLVIDVVKSPANKGDFGEQIYSVVDNLGIETKVMESRFGWDGGSGNVWAISDDEGQIYSLDCVNRTLHILGREGNNIRTIHLLEDKDYYMDIGRMDVSTTGTRIAILLRNRTTDADLAQVLFLLDQDGNQLFRRTIGQKDISGVWISHTGDLILCSVHDRDVVRGVGFVTYVFDSADTELFKINEYPSGRLITKDYLIFGEQQRVFQIDLKDGNIVWTYPIENTAISIVKHQDDPLVISAFEAKAGVGPVLIHVIDHAGNLILKKDLSNPPHTDAVRNNDEIRRSGDFFIDNDELWLIKTVGGQRY
ncbi:hypothetical protein ACFL6Q_04160 [Candidatus Neomarinimicrobiota bacterium]